MVSISWEPVDSFFGNHTSPALTYNRPCPICQSLKSRIVLELDNFQFYTDSVNQPKRVDVRENMCLNCGTMYLNPCYTKYGFRVLFAEAGKSYGSSIDRPVEQTEWLIQNNLIEANSKLLDIGCYDGDFLASLPNYVHKIGIDIDEKAIKRGQSKHFDKDINLIHADFETFQLGGESPSVITMFHVLEHLPNPVDVLRKLKSTADTSTKLIIEVPILENVETNDINGFFSVQHTTHFTKSSFGKCLDLGGWCVEYEDDIAGYNGHRVIAGVKTEVTSRKFMSFDMMSRNWSTLTEYLSSWYSAIGKAQQRIKNIPPEWNVVIWGGGLHTEFLYSVTTLFQADSSREFLIVDSDNIKIGKSWRGIYIYSPDILADLDWSSTVLLVSSYGSQESIVAAAENLEVPSEKIVTLYDEINVY